MVGTDGRILYANPRMAELLDCSEDELVGSEVREFVPDPADVAMLLQSGLEEAARTRERHRLRLRAHSGRVIRALVRASPLADLDAEGDQGDDRDRQPWRWSRT